MSTEFTVDTVSPSQVMAAREYIRRFGHEGPVSDHIVAIAQLSMDEVAKAWAKRPFNDPEKIQAAQILIRLAGGEDHVEPYVVATAHATPAVSEAGAAQ